MNRRILKFTLFLILGVIFMSNCCGFSFGLKYKQYVSKYPEIDVTMDYISDWSYREHKGSYGSYVQVIFYEPQRKNKSFKAVMVVTVQDEAKMEAGISNIKALSDDIVAKRLKFKDAEVLSRSYMKLLDTEAVDIRLSYRTLDKLYAVDAKLIPAKERVVIFKKDDKFYTVRYQNTAEEFDKFDKAFSHMIKTLKIKENK